jgi:TldD protein
MIPVLFALALAAPPSPPSDVVLDAMKDELVRTRELQLSDTPAPYWASYQVLDVEGVVVTATFGALVRSTESRNRVISPRLRVGDTKLDAVGVPMFEEPFVSIDDDYDAVRHALWRFTDGAYKMAASSYRHGLVERAQTTADPEQPDAFTNVPPVVSVTEATPLAVDRAALENLARQVSAVFREHEHIRVGTVIVAVQGSTRRFASTDGALVKDGHVLLSLVIHAATQADDGDMIDRQIVHVMRPDQLPPAATLEADAQRLVEELAALRKAPLVRDYSGPILFESDVAGMMLADIFARELVATGNWSGEVDGKFGQFILPRGVDVVDDPLATERNGQPLLGNVAIDDEGTKSERVELVRDGRLVGLLASRAPGKKVKQSNGHGRSGPFGTEIRPGVTNLVITAKNGASKAAMEKKLLALVRERGAEFGLVFSASGGGHGNEVNAYRLGKDGKRELVRVGHFRGLELGQLRELEAIGKATSVRHGQHIGGMPFPGGMLPTELAGFSGAISVVAPAVLVRTAEVHAFTGNNPKPPAYPRPVLHRK